MKAMLAEELENQRSQTARNEHAMKTRIDDLNERLRKTEEGRDEKEFRIQQLVADLKSAQQQMLAISAELQSEKECVDALAPGSAGTSS